MTVIRKTQLLAPFPKFGLYVRGSDRIFMKILSQMYPWTKNAPLKFGSNPDPESGSVVRIRIWTPDPDHILLGGGMRSQTAFVC